MTGDNIWRAEYFSGGGPRVYDLPGWYATKTERVGGLLQSSFSQRHESEAAARAWCDARNPPGAFSAPDGPTKIEAVLKQLVEDEREQIAEFIETWHASADLNGQWYRLVGEIRAGEHRKTAEYVRPNPGGNQA